MMIVIFNSSSILRKPQSTGMFSIVSFPMSFTPVMNNTSNKTRRFAIFSSSIHSKLRSYIFYTPITAAAWQRLGYEVIVVFVGDWLSLTTNDATILSQLNLTERFLQRLNVHILHFQSDKAHSIKLSQLVRIFSGYLPDEMVHDRDYIITSDSDIIPMSSGDYQIAEKSPGFIYNAFCCGSFQRRNQTYQMYPLSHICLKKSLWRDLFLQSIQRQELLKSDPNQQLLSDKAPYSFELISLYTRHEFPRLYDSNMTKGDAAWYMDQIYISMLINDYLVKNSTIQIDKRQKRSSRLDPGLPLQAWESMRFRGYGDAHIIHDEIFDSFRWSPFKRLLTFLFDQRLVEDFDVYYKQFSLTLDDKPDES